MITLCFIQETTLTKRNWLVMTFFANVKRLFEYAKTFCKNIDLDYFFLNCHRCFSSELK